MTVSSQFNEGNFLMTEMHIYIEFMYIFNQKSHDTVMTNVIIMSF